jgi:hypothetical protein
VRLGVRCAAAAAVLAAVWLATPSALAAKAKHRHRAHAAVGVTLQPSPSQVQSGSQVVLSGTAPPATTVTLYQSPYPYKTQTQIGTTDTGLAGSFSFTVSPDRSTRYRAVLPSTGESATVDVGVTGRTTIKVQALALGRAEVTVLISHPSDLPWNGARVSWSFAHGAFHTAPTTHSRRLTSIETSLTTTVTLPAGHFRWRACLRVPEAGALLDPDAPPGCSGRGYTGSGSLPEGFPSPAAVARAARYLSGRAGRTAFAVVDSEGRMSGLHMHWTFVSASVVKAMLLVAYLRRLHAQGQHRVDSYSNSFLYPMINVSDNNAATQTWSIVGDSGLYSVAHAAGMTDFSIVGIWANAQISAADQAKFFFEMDSLIPHEFVGYARSLLSTIAAYESWGIPAVARPRGYRVFFKGGWRGTGLGQLVHQVGRLEGHDRTFSIAVMTDGDPSMGYGIDTIQGVTSALL